MVLQQAPPWQIPPQQSPAFPQAEPVPEQQAPPLQVPPQHCWFRVHAAAVAPQQTPLLQVPSQQSADVTQAEPAALQQKPALQPPEQHSPATRHAPWLATQHTGSTNAPARLSAGQVKPLQQPRLLAPATQGWPQAGRCTSEGSSTSSWRRAASARPGETTAGAPSG